MSQCGNNNELALQHRGFCTTWSLAAKNLFAYFTMKNSSFAWTGLFCSCVDDVSIRWQMLNSVFLPPKRWFQLNSRKTRAHFASIMTSNNWEMIAETRGYIFRWRSRSRRRRVCLSSLVTADDARKVRHLSSNCTENFVIVVVVIMDSYMEYQLRSKGPPFSLPLFRSRSREEGKPWERGCKNHLHIIKTAQLPFGPSFIPLQMFIQNLELTETSIIWRWNFDSRRGVVSKGRAKYMHTRETRSPPTLARSLSQLAN